MRRKWMVLTLALLALAVVVMSCADKYTTSGKIAFNRKDFDKAIEDFNLAVKTNPANAEAHFYLGKAYKEKGDIPSMVQHFNEAIRLDPKYKSQVDQTLTEVWADQYNAGLSDAKAEKFDKSLKEFQTAIAVQPDKYNPYALAGYSFQKLNNDDSAFIYYQKAYDLNKKEAKPDVKLLEGFASISFNNQKYSKADSLYATLLDLDPNNSEAWLRRGEIADHDSMFDQAVTYYNKSLAIKQDQCDAWFNLGVIYFQHMQKLEDAEQAFTRASDLCPDDVNSLVNLSVVLISLSQTDPSKLDLAIEKLKTMTQKFPTECTGWDLLSQALLRKGDKAGALDANKQYEACQKNPK